MINHTLAKQRGLSENSIFMIEFIHKYTDDLISEAIEYDYSEEFMKTSLTMWDSMLQKHWGFPQDNTLFDKYQFKKQWVGKTFRCTSTGEEFTIPYDVKECDFFEVGEGSIDVGRFGFYSRWSGVEKVVK